MKINRKILTIVTLSYFYLPIMLFLFGWTNIFVALLSIAATLFCLYRFVKNNVLKLEDAEDVCLDPVVIIFGLILFVFIGFFAGWGRFTLQSGDWLKHDAVLCDLVKKSWPVLYENDGEKSMLVYYIAQYLVPAAVGKLVGSVRIAEIALLIWNEIGLILVYLHVVSYLKIVDYIKQAFTALIIPFFSVPLWLSELVLKLFEAENRVGQSEWFYRYGDITLQYSNNYTLLRWVFPQALSAWIIIMLFLEYKDNIEDYLLLMLPGVIYATLSFVGIVPFACVYAIEALIKGKDFRTWILKILSIENIIVLLSQGLVFALYFMGNVLSEKPSDIGFKRVSYAGSWDVYFVFVLVNVAIYAFVLYKDNRKSSVYFVAVATLMILPFFRMGRYNDLGMRSSIPALFVLMLLVIKYINEHFANLESEGRDRLFVKAGKIVIVALLLIGFFYPFREISISAEGNYDSDLGAGTDIDWISLELFANRNLEGVEDDLKYNYYTYDYDEDLFYKYLADKKN